MERARRFSGWRHLTTASTRTLTLSDLVARATLVHCGPQQVGGGMCRAALELSCHYHRLRKQRRRQLGDERRRPGEGEKVSSAGALLRPLLSAEELSKRRGCSGRVLLAGAWEHERRGLARGRHHTRLLDAGGILGQRVAVEKDLAGHARELKRECRAHIVAALRRGLRLLEIDRSDRGFKDVENVGAMQRHARALEARHVGPDPRNKALLWLRTTVCNEASIHDG